MNTVKKQGAAYPLIAVGLLVLLCAAMMVFQHHRIKKETLAQKAAAHEAMLGEMQSVIESHLNSFGLDNSDFEAFATGNLVGIYNCFCKLDAACRPNCAAKIPVDDGFPVEEIFYIRGGTEDQLALLVEPFQKEVSLSFVDMRRLVSDVLKEKLILEATPWFEGEISEQSLRFDSSALFPIRDLRTGFAPDKDTPELSRFFSSLNDILVDLNNPEIITGYVTERTANYDEKIPYLSGFNYALILKNNTASPIDIRSGTIDFIVDYTASLRRTGIPGYGSGGRDDQRSGQAKGAYSIEREVSLRPGESRKVGAVAFRFQGLPKQRGLNEGLSKQGDPRYSILTGDSSLLTGGGEYRIETQSVKIDQSCFSGVVFERDINLSESKIQQLAHQLRYCRIMKRYVNHEAYIPQAVEAAYQNLMSDWSKYTIPAVVLEGIRATYQEKVGTRKENVHGFMNEWLTAFEETGNVPDFNKLLDQHPGSVASGSVNPSMIERNK